MAQNGLNLHVFPTNILFGSRIERVSEFLAGKGIFSRVEIAGISDANLPREERRADGRTVRRFDVRQRLRTHSRAGRALDFLIWYADILRHYRKQPIACVNAHSASVLPLCWLLAKRARAALVYEPHELESETASMRGIMRPVVRAIERLSARRAAAVIAVHDGIARWYEDNLAIGRVWSVRNVPAQVRFEPLPPKYFSRRFGFPDGDLVFLYQGILSEGRGIKILIDAFRNAPPGRQLVFLGFGALAGLAEQAAKELTNVHFHPAVAPEELLRYSAAADVGLLMIEPVSLSYRFCYPNKYCEYLTAGVPVLYSDALWLREEAERYDCGWAAPCEAHALSIFIGALDREAIARKGAGARKWAHENTWQNEEKVLEEIYSGIFGRASGAAG